MLELLLIYNYPTYVRMWNVTHRYFLKILVDTILSLLLYPPYSRASSTEQTFTILFFTIVCSYYIQGLPNRWEPVRFDRLPVKPVRSGSGLGRYQTGSNSKFKFKFKKWKIPKKFLKILQGATNLMVSNFLKNSFI